jgi:hypothetical protein
MKTTLLIEDDLPKKAKARAAVRGTTMSELVNQSLRTYLHASPSASPARLFSLPVFGQTVPWVPGICPAHLAELRDHGR